MFWGSAAPAQADTELWTSLETRIPVSLQGDLWPDLIRVNAGTRYGFRYPGVGLANFRIGPLWEVAPWLMIGLHTSTYAMQDKPDVFEQEIRAELEPNLRWHHGPLSINDRNRFEYRWRPDSISWRYRNQLRLTWHEPEWSWWPTVWDELNLDIGRGQLMQNRAAVGVQTELNDSTRVTLEYIFRSRPVATNWDHDHILNVSLFFGPNAKDILQGDDVGP
jgi:hypothetical protein